jgi:hypothetical protein
MAEFRQSMADIRMGIEALWTKSSIQTVKKPSSTGEFRDRTVTASDLADVSSTVTIVSFIGCRSKEWIEISQRLATLTQLKTLSVEHCDSEDNLCVDVCSSKSLASLCMGK